MKPIRQIEVAELMISVGNFSMAYAKAPSAATRQADLTNPDKPKKVGGLTPEQMARLEREIATVNQDFKTLEETYGDDVPIWSWRRPMCPLVGNDEIERYLQSRHPELLTNCA